eukprot:scaffold16260_cov58-Cyclotella_meneghiniana.AAC.5
MAALNNNIKVDKPSSSPLACGVVVRCSDLRSSCYCPTINNGCWINVVVVEVGLVRQRRVSTGVAFGHDVSNMILLMFDVKDIFFWRWMGLPDRPISW